MHQLPEPGIVTAQLATAVALFTNVRARFASPGVERGGHVREGYTPVYARLAGAHAAQLFVGVDQHHVESSFSTAQQEHIQRTLVVIWRFVVGREGPAPLAEQIVARYVSETRPAFLLALLRAIEDCLDSVLDAHPEEAVTLDAIVRVAGGEGIRDLVCFFGAHLLEQELAGEEPGSLDVTAFVDVHERTGRDGQGQPTSTRYEVWCPGTDLARAVLAQARAAAQTLVHVHGVDLTLSTREEAALLPARIPAYLTRRVQERVGAVLRAYGLPAL